MKAALWRLLFHALSVGFARLAAEQPREFPPPPRALEWTELERLASVDAALKGNARVRGLQ